MGGRGAGKTRAGAEWVRSIAEGPRPMAAGRGHRLGLIGETFDEAREIMVMGESGLLAVSPADRRPSWHASRRVLTWDNGAVAHVLSGHDPDGLRGYQFDHIWVDELGKWAKGQDSWNMLQLGLRLGDDPRACVTTTPRNVPVLRTLLDRDSTVVTHAATSANAMNLSRGFIEEINAMFLGTQLGRQEIEGLLVDDVDGALWTRAQLERAQCTVDPVLDRVVVAVDPPVSHHAGSDACGIVVAGAMLRGPVQEWRAFVLEDCSLHATSPMHWAQTVIDVAEKYRADRVIAEVNQGGAMVESILRSRAPELPYRAVHAQSGKISRAEPIAALYEQGRVFHKRGLQDLEEQMCQMTLTGYEGKGSPDRVDALVWALQGLLLDPIKSWRSPQVRQL